MQYAISFLEGVTAFLSPGLLMLLPVYAVWCLGGGLRTNKQSLKASFGFCLGFGAAFLAAAAGMGVPNPVCGGMLFLLGLLRLSGFEGKVPKLLQGICGAALALYWTGTHGFFPQRLTVEGLLLILAFILGTMIPFLFGGVFLDRLKTELSCIGNYLRETELISGAALLAAGIIIML